VRDEILKQKYSPKVDDAMGILTSDARHTQDKRLKNSVRFLIPAVAAHTVE
jgi:hypothetical protein